jgi:cytochrome c-type biogenesis protein CcmH/NrfF
MTMFSGFSDVKITASYGPFEVEGVSAQLLLWLHPLLLFAISVELLIAERRSRLALVRRDGNEAESA